MSFLRQIGLFVCRLYGDDVPNYTPVERWSMKASKLCSADEIIGAAIIQSFAKDPADWKLDGSLSERVRRYCRSVNSYRNQKGITTSLTNKNKSLVVKFELYEVAADNDDLAPWVNEPIKCFINDIEINSAVGNKIRLKYIAHAQQIEKAKQIADRAKADMERNEAAWNLAEKLLGMKRNEYGALVPVTPVEVV